MTIKVFVQKKCEHILSYMIVQLGLSCRIELLQASSTEELETTIGDK